MAYRIANWDKYQGWKSEQSKRPDGAPTYPWFKVHRKILDSMDFFEVPEPIRWQWIGLLALSDDNGNISVSDDAIAWRFRIKKFDPSPFLGALLLANNQISDSNGSASEYVPIENRLEERRGEEKRVEDKPPSSPSVTDGVFDAFWSAYPRKVGKLAARKAWRKLKLDSKSNEVLDAIARCKTSEQWRKDRGQFIPHPATFLNRGGWDDQPDVPRGLVPAQKGVSADGVAHSHACSQCYDSGAVRSAGVWIRCACHSGIALEQGKLDAANGKAGE